MNEPIEKPCPKCGAVIGQYCIGKRGATRKAFHRERGRRSGSDNLLTHALKTESPIEDVLVAALMEWIDHHDAGFVNVTTQEPFGPYRADIMVRDGERTLVVECDGFRFHSLPHQVEHDKRRDRFCALQGYAVMRFTGVEILRSPRTCAAQIGLWIRRRN